MFRDQITFWKIIKKFFWGSRRWEPPTVGPYIRIQKFKIPQINKIYKHYKIWIMEIIHFFLRDFPPKSKFSKVFWHHCVFYTINCYFEYRIRILCIWLYMGTWFKINFGDVFEHFQKQAQKCEQFSYIFSFLRFFEIFGSQMVQNG